MNEKKLEIYNIINDMEKLDSVGYSRLLSKYGGTLVNIVIENMLSENDKNIYKLDYYVSVLMDQEESLPIDLYDAYVNDMNNFTCLTREENVILTTELHSIVVEINRLLDLIGYDGNSIWISDKIDECLNMSIDSEMLLKLKKLYDKFIEKRNFLVEGNWRLVVSFSKKFCKTGCDFNEIIQLGNIGLMRALEKYDPKYNASISTYAYHWIKQSITRDLHFISSSIYIPYHLVSMNMSMKKVVKELRMVLGREPSSMDIAEFMGISLEKVDRIKILFADTLSLDEPIKNSGAGESEFCMVDTIVDDNVNLFEQAFYDERCNVVLQLLRKYLNDKEYKIICHRFALDNHSFLTLESLGKNMGLTRERIRQIEEKAKRKIRTKCKNLVYYMD